jgi:hypothetical protein
MAIAPLIIFMGIGPRLKKHTYSNGRQAGQGRGWDGMIRGIISLHYLTPNVSPKYPTTKQLGISSPSDDIFAEIPIMLSAPLFDSLLERSDQWFSCISQLISWLADYISKWAAVAYRQITTDHGTRSGRQHSVAWNHYINWHQELCESNLNVIS